jgi:hypothetical protein
MSEELLKYHIQDTGKKFDDLNDSLKMINSRLDDVQAFKMEMIISARWVSLIVSALCGLVTMTGSAVLNYFLTIKISK